MTHPLFNVPESVPGATWHASVQVLASYAAGELDGPDVWSIEAHIAECSVCRAEVSVHAEGERLARNRSVLLALMAVPDAGWLRRVATRCGMPDHLLVLLSATSSLRRSCSPSSPS